MSGTNRYPEDGTLVLELDSAKIAGWKSIRVTRGVERCPSDFDISVTEKFPGSSADVFVAPGQVCRIKIGDDLVLTGYVDRYSSSIEPQGHTVSVIGRSACADIVDCSVNYRSPAINQTNIRDVAEKVCEYYGVKISALAGDGPPLPQILVTLGESPYQLIERVARFAGMLAYDDTSGNLVLNTVGKVKAGSGLKQGVNVLAASSVFAYDQRFTEYHCFIQSTDSFQDFPGAQDGNTIPGGVFQDPALQYLKRPDGQKRNRVIAIITEQWDLQSGNYFALRRAKWEMARRYGRSQALRVTVDSWRDIAGKLWEPNTLVSVDIPACKVSGVEWILGEVSYVRDANGTRADLVVMPPEAYEPEPAIVNPFGAQLDFTPAPQASTTVAPSSDGRRDRG